MSEWPYYTSHTVPLGKTCIGTCSLCGGPVCIPTVWMSVTPDLPKCAYCGASPVNQYGPRIPMEIKDE